jgi:ASC-1-like (ASCH) protein
MICGVMANWHLVILKRPYLEAILAGRKTIESRFARGRWAELERVRAGDGLFFKLSGGSVCAMGRVRKVCFFEDLTAEKIAQLKQRYNRQIAGSDEYWGSKSDCRYGFLVWLEAIKPIRPVWIAKKDWRAWVVLRPGQDFGLLGACGPEPE